MGTAPTEISKAYEPKLVEDKWYADWLAKGCFTANPASTKPAYSIVIPPPNITGMLTMGHVLNNTLQDILARRKRMQGFEVLWLPGTDHASIATHQVLERKLKKEESVTKYDLGREKFLERAWQWKQQYGNIIIQQLKKLGCSCDWARERFTMDDAYSRCVLQVFVDLYKKGLIYRGKRMVNWDPASRTALSDEEVIMTETQGHLWHIQYPIVGSNEFMVVATTRPETMLGDEAVAVNPNDTRYQRLIGKKLLLPLKGKQIPVIADDAVDPKFGTGCVKVTPAHDVADYEMALRHKLPLTVVIGPDGKMTKEAGDDYEDLDRLEAREAVVESLKREGLLLKVEDYTHNVGYSERSNVPVEPYLSEQWFLKYPQVPRSTDAVEKGEIKFYPERWEKTYAHWMTGIRDWCISRQLWWGHRIPVWYDSLAWTSLRMPDGLSEIDRTTVLEFQWDKHVRVQVERPPDPALDHPEWKWARMHDGQFWHQDTDVLDTWFSSWLWPFATMGWPVTGPDIIFFWVARMIMAGYEYMDEKPFSNVYFTGIIRDLSGRKMSKSLGNSPDPLDLIAKYGADGLRFGLMLIAPQGQDILFDEKRCEVGRNFMNKLWNAARFIQMQRAANPPSHPPNVHDLKVQYEMNDAIEKVTGALDVYKFNEAAKKLYDFVWGDFCDWYIEASKVSPNIEVLDKVFSIVLRLLHPFAPFITEELWQGMGYGTDSVQFADCPKINAVDGATAELATRVNEIYEVISAARQLRNEHGISPKTMVNFIIEDKDSRFTVDDRIAIMRLVGNCNVNITDSHATGADPSRVTNAGTIFMMGAVDIETERLRLTKNLADVEKQLKVADAKLANENFTSRAAPIAVQRERERQQQLREQREKVQALLRALQ